MRARPVAVAWRPDYQLEKIAVNTQRPLRLVDMGGGYFNILSGEKYV